MKRLRLTDRQQEILAWIAQGYEIKEAAVLMCIHVNGAGELVARARDANGCKTTAQLLYRLGWEAALYS